MKLEAAEAHLKNIKNVAVVRLVVRDAQLVLEQYSSEWPLLEDASQRVLILIPIET
jgi:hypothetical protein